MNINRIKRGWLLGLIFVAGIASARQSAVTAEEGLVCEPLTLYTSNDGSNVLFIYLDTKNQTLSNLTMVTYSDALKLNLIEERNITSLIPTTASSEASILSLPLNGSKSSVFLFKWTVSETGATGTTSYYETDLSAFDYLSDLPYQAKGGYGNPSYRPNLSFGGGSLNITEQIYAKGIGIHAAGYVKLTLSPGYYQRFVTDVGKNTSQRATMGFRLLLDGASVEYTGAIDKTVKVSWDRYIENVTNLEVSVLTEIDGNGNDHGDIGGARFYRMPRVKQMQTIQWTDEVILRNNKPFIYPLQAISSSGLPVSYHIVSGSEFASIHEGSQLKIDSIPSSAEIIVEAIQPGDLTWNASEVKRCHFQVKRALIVQKEERIELPGGTELEELIVYGDHLSTGQVAIADGLVKVNQLVLKYTFLPGKWNFVSFPSDLDLEKISNLNELGYRYNAAQGAAFFIKRYDGQNRSEKPGTDNWKPLSSPKVQAQQGYIMGINNALGTKPCEVTFTINNATLDFESAMCVFNLTLDFNQSLPNREYMVYVSPQNVRGNTLKVGVNYASSDTKLPLNFDWEVKNARIVYTQDKQAFRITLPDDTPAKIAILNKKGKKLIRAIRYTSPASIDISDLKQGTYQLLIEYGNAIDCKWFEKK